MKLETIRESHQGLEYAIEIHHDEFTGEPWKEHDGHGIVSEWERRDKLPGELILCQDGRAKRFYNLTASLEIARRDGWGLGKDKAAKLAAKLGRQPARREIIAEAVRRDFEYLRGYCNGEWHWLGFTLKIKTPSGEKAGPSVWGFDDREYMLADARQCAKWEIENLKTIERETQIAECVP